MFLRGEIGFREVPFISFGPILRGVAWQLSDFSQLIGHPGDSLLQFLELGPDRLVDLELIWPVGLSVHRQHFLKIRKGKKSTSILSVIRSLYMSSWSGGRIWEQVVRVRFS